MKIPPSKIRNMSSLIPRGSDALSTEDLIAKLHQCSAPQSRSRTRMLLCKQVPIALWRQSLSWLRCFVYVQNSRMKLLWVAIVGTWKERWNLHYMLIQYTHCTSENPSTTINSPCSGFSSLWSPHPAALPELYPLLTLLALVGPMHNLASQQGVDLVSAYLVLQLLHCVGGDAPAVVTNVTIHLKRAGRQVHQARCVYRVKFPGQRLFL